jgi:cold shock CspA family protein
MDGTIAELRRDRGTGFIRGADSKTYAFRRIALQDGWFHDLREGAAVTFEPSQNTSGFRATMIRLVQASTE